MIYGVSLLITCWLKESKLDVQLQTFSKTTSSKACGRYFLTDFYFFTKRKPFKNYCIFFPSFPHFPDLKGQLEVK